jgi:hypothetical protein
MSYKMGKILDDPAEDGDGRGRSAPWRRGIADFLGIIDQGEVDDLGPGDAAMIGQPVKPVPPFAGPAHAEDHGPGEPGSPAASLCHVRSPKWGSRKFPANFPLTFDDTLIILITAMRV